MASKTPRYNPPDPDKQGMLDLFATFPEPQAWALNWDGTALAGPRPSSNGSKPKQQAHS
jgi:hypothetical protein